MPSSDQTGILRVSRDKLRNIGALRRHLYTLGTGSVERMPGKNAGRVCFRQK